MLSDPDGAPEPPRVTIVIPNWNGAHLLSTCLESLRRQVFSDFEILVVDNGSCDDSVRLLRTEFSEATVLALPKNIGFAAACNAGIRAARGGYVVLLNNDTEATEHWLSQLVSVLDSRPDVAFAASKILDFRARDIIDSVADGISLLGVPFKIGQHERDEGQFDKTFEVFGACAAASIYRRSLFDDIGLLDEDFFAYVEDVELSVRAQLAGHRGLFVPAVVYHMGTASTGGGPSPLTVRLTTRNVWWTVLKTLPVPILLVTIPCMIGAQVGLLAHTLLLGRRPWLRRNLNEYFRGLREALAGLPRMLAKRRMLKRRVDTLSFLRQLRSASRQRAQSKSRRRSTALLSGVGS